MKKTRLPLTYLRNICGISLLMISSLSFANANLSNATVVKVRGNHVGWAVVFFSSNLNNIASCSGVSYQNALMLDLNTIGGRGMYAIALQARATGAKVSADGRGACITDDSVEDAQSIEFEEP